MPTRPGYCPACDRFIGPLDTCPYCDCPTERQASVRLLRLLAIAVAVGGLILLALAARRHEIPLIELDAIQPSMNFARVRVEGAVATAPRSGRSRAGKQWFGLTLGDGAARLRVSAFDETAAALLARDDTARPATGAWFRAEGPLSLRAGQPPSLLLRAPNHLQPRPPP